MKALPPKNVAFVAGMLALALLGLAAFSGMELHASNVLLERMTLLQPGININTVQNQLGQLMYEKTNFEEIVSFGSVKDESFCRGKKLFWFAAPLPPARAIEVYTDANNIVAYVTWRVL
jgi:hypothetical protein